MEDFEKGHAVYPKTDCPHVTDANLSSFNPDQFIKSVDLPCNRCGDRSENWICLKSDGVFCSRYVNGHMAEHAETTGHDLALSLADLSVWCYKCESYITDPKLKPVFRAVHMLKFGEEPVEEPRVPFPNLLSLQRGGGGGGPGPSSSSGSSGGSGSSSSGSGGSSSSSSSR
eukprot:GEZU01010185.1.p1 GENE.GEZU01010185.1~~GEZU01010185.1.p1  ORF type:complete len:195 (-),score=23.64 GEZU01010185.1:37-549(-)